MMAGRKRKHDARRQPGGRIDHRTRQAQTERASDVVAVALEARRRVYGLSAAQAVEMPEPSFLGRLKATREISPRQYEAATSYRDIVEAYDHLHPVKGFPEAGNLDRGGGYDGKEADGDYIARFQSAVRRFRRVEGALIETWNEDAHAATVVKNVVLKGYDMPHMVPSLRVGLNAIARSLRLPY